MCGLFYVARVFFFFFLTKNFILYFVFKRAASTPGRYMHMMDVLKPIAAEVFACLKELFDYYIFTVVTFFGDKVREIMLKSFVLLEVLKQCSSETSSWFSYARTLHFFQIHAFLFNRFTICPQIYASLVETKARQLLNRLEASIPDKVSSNIASSLLSVICFLLFPSSSC